jgi:cell filamentation protein
LRELIGESAPSTAIANARTELAYVRHAKGPIYQSHLLTYLGVRQVDAVVTAQQTPLERVREIGAALGVQINGQQSAQLQRAVRALERPILPRPFTRARAACRAFHQEHARKEPCRSTPFARASDCRCRHEDGGQSG